MKKNKDCESWNTFPHIITACDDTLDSPNLLLYKEFINNVLRKILPKEIFLPESASDQEKNNALDKILHSLPVMHGSNRNNAPSILSFSVLSKYRESSFKFFFELVSRWLVPGKRLNVVSVFAADFSIPEKKCKNMLFTLCEVMLHIDQQVDMDYISRNLPIIESEVCLGMPSDYYARRILESRGLSLSEKFASVHGYIARIIQKRPSFFEKDIITEMQYFLVTCKDAFLAERSVRHLGRIIYSQYLIRKKIKIEHAEQEPMRYMELKIFQTFVKGRPVLCLLMGLSFMKDKEIFEKERFFKAVSAYLPDIVLVEGSIVKRRRGSEKFCTMYMEIEKESGQEFSSEDMKSLRLFLPSDLEGRREDVMHPVFMPRNEEDVMRNILQLGEQMRYVRDVPQVCISFDEQLRQHLVFTVIVVRLIKDKEPTIASLFSVIETSIEYLHDRTKMIGYVRKKYQKEATVFRIRLEKKSFIRRDHVLDLYRARYFLVEKLKKVLGNFRDYNGGMITKQNELLELVRTLLGENIGIHDLLLENFFHSITPVVMRTVLDPLSIKDLFLMIVSAVNKKSDLRESHLLEIQETEAKFYFLVTTRSKKIIESFLSFLREVEYGMTTLAHSCINLYGVFYLSAVYAPHTEEETKTFKEGLLAVIRDQDSKISQESIALSCY
jgi:hypothetical protein